MGFARFRTPSGAKRRRSGGEEIGGPSDLGLVAELVSTDGAGDAVAIEPRPELLIYRPRGWSSSARSSGPRLGYQTHPDRDADEALRGMLATLGAFRSGQAVHPGGTGELEPPGGGPLVVLESHSLPQKTTPPTPSEKGTPPSTGPLPPELVLELEAIIAGLRGHRLRMCPWCERPFLVKPNLPHQRRCGSACLNAEGRAEYEANKEERQAYERDKKRRQRAAKKKKPSQR